VIKRKTVFVVGAGASFELKFPLGEELVLQIGKALKFSPSTFGETTSTGDKDLWQTIKRHASQGQSSLGEYLQAALKVSAASHLGISIDNIVHQLGNQPLVAVCAKFGIARRILDAEASCALRETDEQPSFQWAEARGTWLGGFAQLLVQDLQRTSLEGIFQNVSIISFNYDRNVRRFLPLVLQSQFGIEESEARELSKGMRIFHPYGSIGPLPWEGLPAAVAYGKCRLETMLTAAGNLRTFTEQIEDESHLADMRAALSEAERIVFLGFSYLPQNMELLTRGMVGSADQIMGTCYNLSAPDQTLVAHKLGHFFPVGARSYREARLSDMVCAQFIRENFRTLAS
jgi:hypothetical protein